MAVSVNNQLSALIVDDEKEACTNLANILHEYVDASINILGVAHNTAEAYDKIKALSPDAVFLDIEMPNENAFHFLERIVPFDFEVIFVTAYDEYAIRAFRLNAIDYILKPISIPELTNAVKKLKEKLRYKKLIAGQQISYADLSAQVRNKIHSQKITLKDGSNFDVVEFRDIYFIEAQGSYSKILYNKAGSHKEIMLSGSLSDYEEVLPAVLFYRIHKSYLVNCMHIREITRGEVSYVVINEQTSLPVSRRRFPMLIEFLKSNDYAYE